MILKTSYKLKPPPSARLIRSNLLGGLVGCWLMNEGSGLKTYDLSGYNRHGTFYGCTSWAVNKFGSCLRFNGDGDGVDVPYGFGTTAATQIYTVSVWVKTNDTMSGRSIWDGTFQPSLLFYSNKFNFYGAGLDLYSIDVPTLGRWYHIVCTWNVPLSRAELFVDGISNAVDTTITTQSGYTASTIGISCDYSAATSFNGLIDNYMIWNRVLTAEEVKQLYQDPFFVFQRRLRPLTAAAETIVTPSAPGLAAGLQAPTADVTVAPSILELAAGLQVPTVITDVTVAPSILELAGSLQAPTVVAGVTVAPSALGLAAGLPVPTVVGDVTITPSILELAAGLPVPTVITDVTVTPSILELAASLLTATVIWPQVARRSHVGFRHIEGADRLRGLRRNALY